MAQFCDSHNISIGQHCPELSAVSSRGQNAQNYALIKSDMSSVCSLANVIPKWFFKG